MKQEILNNKLLKEIYLTNESNNYFVIHNNKTYKVTETLYIIMKYLKIYELDLALQIIEEKLGIEKKDHDLLYKQIISFLDTINKPSITKNYIFFKRTFFNQNITNLISDKLKFLFNKTLFLSLSLISLFINILFFLKNKIFDSNNISIGTYEIILFYASITLILIAHEFGHSSACKYYGVTPKEIGFGIYLFFPILYSNVSGIWILQKNKRIIVNLGGIYFQLIINLLLFFLFFYFNDYGVAKVLQTLIKVNTFIIIYSLIPFIRNDGYWIYSDYFEIPNLNQKSNKLPKKIFPIKNIWIFIYSIGNYIFTFYIIYALLSNILKLSIRIKSINYSNDINSIYSALKPNLFSFFISVIFLVFLIKSLIVWINNNLISSKVNHVN